MNVRFPLFALSLFLCPATVLADSCRVLDPEVQRLLQAISSNAQRVNYSGVVTLQRGGDMQVIELSHGVSNNTETEAISRLTGQDARVERTGHPTGCMHPGHQLLQGSANLEGGVCGLGESYRFRIVQGDRIAGRAALRLRAEPLDMYRFGYVFEVDRDTALILKSTTMATDQRVLEQFQFASIELEAAPVAAAQTAHQAQHPHPQEAPAVQKGPSWEVVWLPRGFVPTDSVPRHSPRKSYTDGLASFSVFLEPLSRAIKPGEGVERQGSTIAYTRGVLLNGRPVLVTVLGEIPTNTARMVADAVRLR